MEIKNLDNLINSYKKSPTIFHAGRYWQSYEDKIYKEIQKADVNQLRSGRYPIFGTFGFSESVYHYHPNSNFFIKLMKKIIRKYIISNRSVLPYSLSLKDIREMAYNNCIKQAKLSNLKCISQIETSEFGNPSDLFEIKGKKYSMQFLNFYIRLCFAQRHLNLKGNETIVELGYGSGFQVEVLKKVFPKLTILCFDLPFPLVLCEKFISESLGSHSVVSSAETSTYKDLKQLENGKVYFFGNWQFPILKDFNFDVFWNAASFGEMEPHIVKNYLKYIIGSCKFIYLLQARKGKESSKSSGVVSPITFLDYKQMLTNYELKEEIDAFEAHRRMSQSGGYFQAVWESKI